VTRTDHSTRCSPASGMARGQGDACHPGCALGIVAVRAGVLGAVSPSCRACEVASCSWWPWTQAALHSTGTRQLAQGHHGHS